MGAEAARGCKGGALFPKVVDAAVAFTKLADAQEAVAVERRGVAVAAEACCCCEGVRAPPAAAGLDLSFSRGLLFNDVVVFFSEESRLVSSESQSSGFQGRGKKELAACGTRKAD